MNIDAFNDPERALRIARALASGTRLRILRSLGEGTLTLAQLHGRMDKGSDRASIYRHLRKLVDAGLVEAKYDPVKGRRWSHQFQLKSSQVIIDL